MRPPQVAIIGDGVAAAAAAVALQGPVARQELDVVVIAPRRRHRPFFSHELVLGRTQGDSEQGDAAELTVDWGALRPLVSNIIHTEVASVDAARGLVVTAHTRARFDALVVCGDRPDSAAGPPVGLCGSAGALSCLADPYALDLSSAEDVAALPAAVADAARRIARGPKELPTSPVASADDDEEGGSPGGPREEQELGITLLIARSPAAKCADMYARHCEDEQCTALIPCKLALTYPTFTDLDLHGQGVDGAALLAACAALRTNLTLRRISLRDCAVDGEHAGLALATLLGGCAPVREVDASGNCIGSNGVEALAAGVRGAPFLATLDLSDNELDPESGPLLAEAVSGAPAMRELRMAGNDLGAEGAAPLLLAAAGLQLLDLSDNDITINSRDTAAAAALAAAVSAPGEGRILRLGGNILGEAGAAALGDALLSGEGGLRELGLRLCFTSLQAQFVLDCCTAHPGLQTLDIVSRDALTLQGAIRLATALEHNTVLRTLHATLDAEKHTGLLLEALRSNSTLTALTALPVPAGGGTPELPIPIRSRLESNRKSLPRKAAQTVCPLVPTPFHFIPLLAQLAADAARELGCPPPPLRVVAESSHRDVIDYVKEKIVGQLGEGAEAGSGLQGYPVEFHLADSVGVWAPRDGALGVADAVIPHELLVAAGMPPVPPAVLRYADSQGLLLTQQQRLGVDVTLRVLSSSSSAPPPDDAGPALFAAGGSAAEVGAVYATGLSLGNPAAVAHSVRQGFVAGYNAGVFAATPRAPPEVQPPLRRLLSVEPGDPVTDAALGELLPSEQCTPLCAARVVFRQLFHAPDRGLPNQVEYLRRWLIPHAADGLLSALAAEQPKFAAPAPPEVPQGPPGAVPRKAKGGARQQRKSCVDAVDPPANWAAPGTSEFSDISDWAAAHLAQTHLLGVVRPVPEKLCGLD